MTSTQGNERRAGLYFRVSTEDQAREGYSMGDQERRGLQVAEREGWAVELYREPGRSGADRDRPELARLLRDVDAGKLDVVWFDTQDRLARDVGFTADLVATFIDADVEAWEGSQPIDLSDDGQAAVDLKALFAAWERRKIKGRTKKGIAAYSRTGKHWGAPPYGWRRTEDGTLEHEPAEEGTYARIFDLYLSLGGSYNGVAAQLNREGVRPRKDGATWGSSQVKNVIARPYEPIVSAETFEAAQRLAQQSRKYAPHGGGRVPARHVFVRGSLRCACGAAMLPRSERKRGKLRETYECSVHKKMGVEACPMPIFTRVQVETAALCHFERDALNFEATRAHIAEQLEARITESKSQAARATREAAELRTQADRVVRDYRRGALEAEDYATFKAEIAGELAAAEAEAERLTAHAEETAATRANLDAEHEALRRLTELREAIAGRVNEAGSDVGALRTAIAAVFECFWIVPSGALSAEPWLVVPQVRPEMRDERVPIPFAVEPGENQHGTVLWKYMTQNTLRLS